MNSAKHPFSLFKSTQIDRLIAGTLTQAGNINRKSIVSIKNAYGLTGPNCIHG
jgi:hypothetical protein